MTDFDPTYDKLVDELVAVLSDEEAAEEALLATATVEAVVEDAVLVASGATDWLYVSPDAQFVDTEGADPEDWDDEDDEWADDAYWQD